MKKKSKVIAVLGLSPSKNSETADMVAELTKGAEPKWPVRFKSTGATKQAALRR